MISIIHVFPSFSNLFHKAQGTLSGQQLGYLARLEGYAPTEAQLKPFQAAVEPPFFWGENRLEPGKWSDSWLT